MIDKHTALIGEMIAQRLDAVSEELSKLNTLLEGFAASRREEADILEKQRAAVRAARQAVSTVNSTYMSGQWHRRSGDVYGIVAAQPTIHVPELPSANDPPGDIRSTSERGD